MNTKTVWIWGLTPPPPLDKFHTFIHFFLDELPYDEMIISQLATYPTNAVTNVDYYTEFARLHAANPTHAITNVDDYNESGRLHEANHIHALTNGDDHAESAQQLVANPT